jgi:hypothetical protein
LRNANGVRHLVHGIMGQIAFLSLNFLQDRDEMIFTKIVLSRDDLIHVTHTAYLGAARLVRLGWVKKKN